VNTSQMGIGVKDMREWRVPDAGRGPCTKSVRGRTSGRETTVVVVGEEV